MWQMLQQPAPEDYVIGMGETHSVRELCELAFKRVDLDYRDYVIQDPKFYRPAEVDLLVSDPTKAHEKLGWRPEVSFAQLVEKMVEADLDRITDASQKVY
jgi:GDPmannose 4,6-dehydratase